MLSKMRTVVTNSGMHSALRAYHIIRDKVVDNLEAFEVLVDKEVESFLKG